MGVRQEPRLGEKMTVPNDVNDLVREAGVTSVRPHPDRARCQHREGRSYGSREVAGS